MGKRKAITEKERRAAGKPNRAVEKERLIKKENVLFSLCVVAILVLAFWVRYKGIMSGFPLITHPDEPAIVVRALRIIFTRDLNPHFFNYPSLPIYLQSILYLVVYSIGKVLGVFHQFTDINPLTFYFYGRLLTIILSVGTIYLVYVTAGILFDRTTSLIAILLISFSYLHFANSYFITTDSPMAFWASLSFFFAALSYKNGPKLKYYIFHGIAAGLAISTKYTAFLCVLPMAYAHAYNASFSIRKMIHKNIMIAAALTIATFIVTTPFSLFDYAHFRNDVLYEAQHYSIGHSGAENGSNHTYKLKGCAK